MSPHSLASPTNGQPGADIASLPHQRVAQLYTAASQRQGVDIAHVRAASTSQIPLGRCGDPQELGEVVAFLVLREGKLCNRNHDGGQTLLRLQREGCELEAYVWTLAGIIRSWASMTGEWEYAATL